ncbi:hypothetical protein NL108_000018, partial [Boleophthalmus pectinirostris]
MNNLNDPPRWNIQPDGRRRGPGAEDGNQWNYALLVPMLGLAAFRECFLPQSVKNGLNYLDLSDFNCFTGWIWTRDSQREIQEVKSQYEKDVSIIKDEMEARYRETLSERRRAAASLELELEKERQRVTGYKQALISQSQQLMEERKKLQK